LVTRSPIIGRMIGSSDEPHIAMGEAEILSSMSQRVAVLTDNLGFMNSLGYLGAMRVRGSVVVIVFDVDDVRPLCDYLSLPCLEPWDQESLDLALREGVEYSEVFELPYVVRVGPWIRVGDHLGGVARVRRPVTFNRNWSRGSNWGLWRMIRRPQRDLSLVANRARGFVVRYGSGEGVVVSGSAWGILGDKLGGYLTIRSLYLNPIPREELGGCCVIDINDYLERKLGLRRIMVEDASRGWDSLINEGLGALFFRRPGDPLMLVEWAIIKSTPEGQVPLVVGDPTLVPRIDEPQAPSYDTLPTWFVTESSWGIYDVVTDPVAALLGVRRVNYDLGRVIVVARECSMAGMELNSSGDYTLLIIDYGECSDQVTIRGEATSLTLDDDVRVYFELVNALSRGGIVLIKVPGRRGEPYGVYREYCDSCGDCLRIGCPAILLSGGIPRIDPNLCVGCGICAMVCTRGAIVRGSAVVDESSAKKHF